MADELVLVGGAGARETLAGLVTTAENLAAYGYVVWLNSFFGPVGFDDKPFEETKAFGRIRGQIDRHRADEGAGREQ